MEKRKVGIITLYYKSNNYGGIAQSYALYKYLDNKGFDVKLISFAKKPKKQSIGVRLKKRIHLNQGIHELISNLLWIVKWGVKSVIIKRIKALCLKKYKTDLKKRENCIGIFRESIPHTDVYTKDTIVNCVPLFDIFVSGSDQIWKPSVVQEPYVLNFVSNEKLKVSYASSVTTSNIIEDKEYCRFMKKHLSSYKAISVREEESKYDLQKILKRDVEFVVDPTLLLDESEWETITQKRIINEKYLFTYFLGNDSRQKQYVEKFAHENSLVIVNLPFVSGEYNRKDCHFGDYKLYEIGLPEFFSLIKYAEVVFTDSFHAVCFSWIFKTKFFVFDRHVGFDGTKMNSRIDSILRLMELENRKIDITSTVSLDDMISFSSPGMMKKIEFSKEFIEKNIIL